MPQTLVAVALLAAVAHAAPRWADTAQIEAPGFVPPQWAQQQQQALAQPQYFSRPLVGYQPPPNPVNMVNRIPERATNVLIHIVLENKDAPGTAGSVHVARTVDAQTGQTIRPKHTGQGTMEDPIVITKDIDRDTMEFLGSSPPKGEEGPANLVQVKAMIATSSDSANDEVEEEVDKELDKAIPIILDQLEKSGVNINTMDAKLKEHIEQAIIEEVAKSLQKPVSQMRPNQGQTVSPEDLDRAIEEAFREVEKHISTTPAGPGPTTAPPIFTEGTTRIVMVQTKPTEEFQEETEPTRIPVTAAPETRPPPPSPTIPSTEPPTERPTAPPAPPAPPATQPPPPPTTLMPRTTTEEEEPEETEEPEPETEPPSPPAPPVTEPPTHPPPPPTRSTTQRPATTTEKEESEETEEPEPETKPPLPPAPPATEPPSPPEYSTPPAPLTWPPSPLPVETEGTEPQPPPATRPPAPLPTESEEMEEMLPVQPPSTPLPPPPTTTEPEETSEEETKPPVVTAPPPPVTQEPEETEETEPPFPSPETEPPEVTEAPLPPPVEPETEAPIVTIIPTKTTEKDDVVIVTTTTAPVTVHVGEEGTSSRRPIELTPPPPTIPPVVLIPSTAMTMEEMLPVQTTPPSPPQPPVTAEPEKSNEEETEPPVVPTPSKPEETEEPEPEETTKPLWITVSTPPVPEETEEPEEETEGPVPPFVESTPPPPPPPSETEPPAPQPPPYRSEDEEENPYEQSKAPIFNEGAFETTTAPARNIEEEEEDEVQPVPDMIPVPPGMEKRGEKDASGPCPTSNNPADKTRADVLFLLDSSSTFTEEKFGRALHLISDTVKNFSNIGPDGVQVSLVQYNKEPYLEFSLRRHNCKDFLLGDIADTKYMRGASMLGKALDKVSEFGFTPRRGDRPSAENVLVIVTDGQSEDKVQQPVKSVSFSLICHLVWLVMSQSTASPTYEDDRLTKIFVGGLNYATTSESLHQYFRRFGEIEEAVVITDRFTQQSKGYGFVRMKTAEGATNACGDPCPIIEGRRTNVHLAHLGARQPRTAPAPQLQTINNLPTLQPNLLPNPMGMFPGLLPPLYPGFDQAALGMFNPMANPFLGYPGFDLQSMLALQALQGAQNPELLQGLYGGLPRRQPNPNKDNDENRQL